MAHICRVIHKTCFPTCNPAAPVQITLGDWRTTVQEQYVQPIASFCWKLTFFQLLCESRCWPWQVFVLFRWKESWGAGPCVCLGAAAHLAEKKRPDPLLYFPAIYLHVFRKSRSLGKCRTECLRVLCWRSRWDSMPVNDLDILCINLGKLHVPHVRGGRGPQILLSPAWGALFTLRLPASSGAWTVKTHVGSWHEMSVAVVSCTCVISSKTIKKHFSNFGWTVYANQSQWI